MSDDCERGRPPEYPFPADPEASGYRVFPDDVEDDPHIFFHGTAESRLESILKDGFTIPGPLPSLSLARDSSLSLRYASEARSAKSPKGVVIAVRMDDVNRPGIVSEAFGLHLYTLEPQPVIVGYCIVPPDYNHV